MIIQINEYPTIPPMMERMMFWVNTKFRSGKKFFTKASMITPKFNGSGMIKCLRSIKNIITYIANKIDSNTDAK